jgi:YHS domain-containing protein
MKNSLALFCAALFTVAASSAAFARPEAKPSCPIMKHAVSKIDPKLSTVYKGKTFYYCCAGCKPAFEKMSDKDKVALMKYGVDNKKSDAKKPATPAKNSKKAA